MEKYKSVSHLQKDVSLLSDKVSLDTLANTSEEKLAELVFCTLSKIKEGKDEVGLLFLKRTLLELYKAHVQNPDDRTVKISAMCKVAIRAIKEIEQNGYNN